MADVTDKDSALIALAESGAAQFWKGPFDSLSASERTFRLIWELEGEVNNGGFHQYFGNSSGDMSLHAVAALKEIGATQTAGIVQRALSVFGPLGPSPSQDVRLEQLEDLSVEQEALLEALDTEFYRYPDNLTTLLYQYVQAHRGQIRGAEDAF